MNLFELFIKIGVDDQASGKLGELSGKLGNGLKTAAKIGTAAVGAATAAITALTTQSVNSFAEYEQLAGGAKKIFNDMDYSKIATDANNAYKDLGLSANQYLAVINDVGATFAATMGDEAGYEAAKTGLKAISDYASGTGKNVDELSQKFTLITRSTSSYQSIADQFSGILPATSAGFLEQAQAAGILSDSYTQLTEVPIDEYQAAVSQMLQQGVADLGLADNTMNEAFSTLSGSLAMTKGAWSNLVTGLADDSADMDLLINNLVDSVVATMGNLLPRVEQVFLGIGVLVEGLAPVIGEALPNMVSTVLPSLLESGGALLFGIMDGIVNNFDALIDTAMQVIDMLLNGIIDNLPRVIEMGVQLIGKLAVGIVQAIPDLVLKVPEIIMAIIDGFAASWDDIVSIGENIVQGIWDGISAMGGWIKEKVTGFFGGIVDTAKDLLGIHSPSTVFAGIGAFMAEGLAEGWDKEYNGIKRSIESGLNFGAATVDFSSSGLGMSSAGMINAVEGSTGGINLPSVIELRLSANDGQTFGRWMVPFIRAENKSNPEVVSDA